MSTSRMVNYGELLKIAQDLTATNTDEKYIDAVCDLFAKILPNTGVLAVDSKEVRDDL